MTERSDTLPLSINKTPSSLSFPHISKPHSILSFNPNIMDNPQEHSVGIKIYKTPSRKDVTPQDTSTLPSSLPKTTSKRQAVAKGVQKTISKTSMLANFLPTGTLLTFEMLLPSVSRNGDCSASVTTLMIMFLLALCCLSCFFFHFTDSFRGPDGNLYYGIVTPKGLAVFRTGLGLEVPKDEKYKLGVNDMVHAVMSVMVFLAIALSDHRVLDCVFPKHVKDMEMVMESLPLMVGIVCSSLFLVFPTTRHGVGLMTS